MLWRALSTVEVGFYIDLGACHPDLASVTRAFYDRGWRGINVEPNPDLLPAMQQQRPRDFNLQLAVGSREEVRELVVMRNAGLSTLDDEVARRHEAAGEALHHVSVPTVTLRQLWEEYVPPEQAVHFLKVDVEGYEQQVVAGADWRRHRPWVLVLEAMLPNRQVPSHQTWEPLLTAAGYRFVYADGLNRFYLAEEQAHLAPAFAYPPNVFDSFETAEVAWLREQNGHLHEQTGQGRAALDSTKAEIDSLREHNRHLREQARQRSAALERKTAEAARLRKKAPRSALRPARQQSRGAPGRDEVARWRALAEDQDQQIEALHASLSWRITAPLRLALGLLLRSLEKPRGGTGARPAAAAVKRSVPARPVDTAGEKPARGPAARPAPRALAREEEGVFNALAAELEVVDVER